MSENVIAFVADANYLNHAKAFMVNARRQGGWRDDFCLIASGAQDTSDIERRGIFVCPVPGEQWDFLVKFHAFDPFFHRWKKALCIDLDVIVQGPLQKIFDGLGPRLPKIQADVEDGTTIAALRHWDPKAAEHEATFAEIERRFPHCTQRMFNAAFLFYQPDSMPVDTRAKLLALHEEFRDVNPTNADQMLLNLLLHDRMELAGKDFICFFGMDWHCNRIPSEFRRWRGDEEPVILHYCRWAAPWIIKEQPTGAALQGLLDLGLTPETGGYQCHRLGRVCHELYAENLAAFDKEFPVIL